MDLFYIVHQTNKFVAEFVCNNTVRTFKTDLPKYKITKKHCFKQNQVYVKRICLPSKGGRNTSVVVASAAKNKTSNYSTNQTFFHDTTVALSCFVNPIILYSFCNNQLFFVVLNFVDNCLEQKHYFPFHDAIIDLKSLLELTPCIYNAL